MFSGTTEVQQSIRLAGVSWWCAPLVRRRYFSRGECAPGDGGVKVRRPVLRYHGGKWKLAPWIISHFPAHRVYVEPFGGAASVLLRKDRVACEVYNDLDGDVCNLFRVLRDESQAEALVRALELTPFARDEFDLAFEPVEDEDSVKKSIECARRLVVRSYMGQGSNACTRNGKNGFRSKRAGASSPAHDWVNYPDALRSVIERLRGVTFENRAALDILKRYDSANTLFYVDPPYPHSVRTQGPASYRHEMTDEDHAELARALNGVKGMVFVSGYMCDLYADLYSGWRRVVRSARADKAVERTECLWISSRAEIQGSLLEAV